MAMSVVRQFTASTDQMALMVAFLTSTGSTESSGCSIDSQNPEGLGGIMGAEYSLHVQLDRSSQSLVIHETVSGLNGGNAVEGTFRIPISLFEKPKFHNAAGRGNTRIKISFALREGKFLKNKHFKWHTKGTWSNMTARALQMWKYEEWASTTRTIDIVLLNAPKNAYEMKGDIERALGLPVNKALRPHSASLPANAHSGQSLFGTPQQTPRAGIARIPIRSSPAIQDKETATTLQSQKPLMQEQAELARKLMEEEEAKLNIERDAAIEHALLSVSISPSTGTSIFPFMPFLEKDTPNSVQINAYQSITFMLPYLRYSFEELRLADYKSGHTIGELVEAQPVRSILAEQKHQEEQAVKSKKEAKDLRTELVACKANNLAKQIELTDHAKLIDGLQIEAKNLEVKYRASLDRIQVLQSTIQALEEYVALRPTQSNATLVQNSTKAVSTSQSESCALFVKYTKENDMDIFDVHDQEKIVGIASISNQSCQNISKIDFRDHDVAAEVLNNVKLRIQELYADCDNAPEVDYFIDNFEVLNDSAATKTEDFDTEKKLRQKNAALEAHNQSLRSDLTAREKIFRLETAKNAEATQKLQAENENLKQQIRAVNATSLVTTTEDSSVDLLGLDFSQDAEVDSIPILTTNTVDQPTPDWLNEYFPATASTPLNAEPEHHHTTTAPSGRSTGILPTPISSTPASARPITPDPDMILRIDDAVDSVGIEARKALKAGKGVTVQITEPDAIPDWLEQVNRRIVINGRGFVRAVP